MNLKKYENQSIISVFRYKNKSCQQCLTENHNFQCGGSYELLNKLNELENSEECENENFSLHYNSTSKSFIFKNETCDLEIDNCCLEIACKK